MWPMMKHLTRPWSNRPKSKAYNHAESLIIDVLMLSFSQGSQGQYISVQCFEVLKHQTVVVTLMSLSDLLNHFDRFTDVVCK